MSAGQSYCPRCASGAQRVLATHLSSFSQQVVDQELEPKCSDCGKREADILVSCYQLLSFLLEKVAQTRHPNSDTVAFFSEILACRKGLDLAGRVQVFPPRQCREP